MTIDFDAQRRDIVAAQQFIANVGKPVTVDSLRSTYHGYKYNVAGVQSGRRDVYAEAVRIYQVLDIIAESKYGASVYLSTYGPSAGEPRPFPIFTRLLRLTYRVAYSPKVFDHTVKAVRSNTPFAVQIETQDEYDLHLLALTERVLNEQRGFDAEHTVYALAAPGRDLPAWIKAARVVTKHTTNSVYSKIWLQEMDLCRI